MTHCNQNLAALITRPYICIGRLRRVVRLTVAVLLALALTVFMAPLALADQADPDSNPTVTMYAYRNLLESGDMLLFIYGNIPYASTPDALVTRAFIWRMIDSDNTTVLGQTVGYVSASNDPNGYGYNVYSMYWDSTDAPTWGQTYTIRLSGNPAVFDDPPIYDYTLQSSDYSSLTVQADVQAELASRVITTALDLNTRWGLTTLLTTELETGTVLSQNAGEGFFRGAIYGLQALAPSAFSLVALTISAADRSWSATYETTLQNQYAGTWVETAQTAGTDFFNTTYDLVSIIIVLVCVFGIVIANVIIANDVWIGMIDATFVAIMFARLGFYELSFLAFVAGVAWIYVSAKTFGMVR